MVGTFLELGPSSSERNRSFEGGTSKTKEGQSQNCRGQVQCSRGFHSADGLHGELSPGCSHPNSVVQNAPCCAPAAPPQPSGESRRFLRSTWLADGAARGWLRRHLLSTSSLLTRRRAHASGKVGSKVGQPREVVVGLKRRGSSSTR